ncbi:MAG: FliI/YscN family ATPase [Planctomycetes bacterium]|nr:FliI/YscN family ATPase [Planctomycetota bacterium]
MPPDLAQCERVVRSVPMGTRAGVLTQVVGLLLECRGLPAAMGDLCRIIIEGGEPLLAEVCGFREGATLLLPLGEAEGLRPGARVEPLGRKTTVGCCNAMLGRVLDALGKPMDAGPALVVTEEIPLMRAGPPPLERAPIDRALPTGVSVLDGFLTLGRGQRMGIFAGSGVGKSTLLADIARTTLSSVNVIALVGERGREVGHFIEEALGKEGMARSVVIVATSDMPALLRIKAAFTAAAVAEYFRDQGHDVMMMVDSVTRLAAAAREAGLALGEPPTVKGYPPSFFALMPRLVERLGRTRKGSITGLFTVLVDGDDMNDPVADTLRGLLDGHVVLSRDIAQRGMFPAVDVLKSVSRIMDKVVSPEHLAAARTARGMLASWENSRDLVAIGAYKPGTDAKLDRALQAWPRLEALLRQEHGSPRSMEETLTALGDVCGDAA